MAIQPPGSPQRQQSAPQTTPPGAPVMHADEPTLLLPSSQEGQRRTAGGLWPRTLRWRLIATYALLLGLTLLLLGVGLNIFIARTLYASEFSFFQNEALASVSVSQPRFDTLTLGSGTTCANALPYEVAFEQTIARPILISHPGSVQGVYLLDGSGNVLAPLNAQSGTNGTRYLSTARLTRLATSASSAFSATGAISASQQLANDGYFVSKGSASYGVELIALRYYSSSRCVTPHNMALGYVEIVTTFTRTRQALSSIRLTLIIIMGLVFVVGLLIGAPLVSVALRPLSQVTRAARRVASGDLSQRVRLRHSDDEMGQLAMTFDEMVARIEAAFSARRRSEERMRQFIADASHELRTPLTSIRGYTDVLLRGAKENPETTERVLLATRREAERMSRLVNDLLTLARLDTGRPLETQTFDLIALAGECVDQARILADERQVIIRTDRRGHLMLTGDSDRLKQVMLVLLDNALKYGRQTPDGWVRLSVGRNDGLAIVTIEDNGPGIAQDDLPRIFERFYRAERAASIRRMTGAGQPSGQPPQQPDARAVSASPKGSGLGLAIAQAIAQAHGGSLTAQSTPGAGATFTLTLPITPPSQPQQPMARAAPRPGA